METYKKILENYSQDLETIGEDQLGLKPYEIVVLEKPF